MNIEPKIIYQNKDLLVIDKPAGLLVHPHKLSNEQTVTEWLIKKFPEVDGVGEIKNRPGMVHRLDKGTSGLMIIAKNQATFLYLKNLFQTHQIKKTYIALVYGRLVPKEGIINKPFGILGGSLKRSIRATKMVKEAVTEYKVKKYFKDFSLVEVWPKTGRTHQIRVHLSSLGHPVVGDELYAPKKMIEKWKSLNLNRFFLHAESLEFTAPSEERLKIKSDLPEELERILKTVERLI